MWHIKNVYFVFLFVLLGAIGQHARAQELVLYALHLPPHMIDASIVPPPKGMCKRYCVKRYSVKRIQCQGEQRMGRMSILFVQPMRLKV